MVCNSKYFFAAVLLTSFAFAQQDHSQHQMPAKPSAMAASFSVTQSTSGITLDSLLQLARENNPTLKQAAAEIRTAEARRRQAGALPNPTVGYVGEDIRGGVYRGGQHGFFVEQPIVLGGKLGAARGVFAQHVEQARLEAEEQRLRVDHGVRSLFYRALAAQQSAQVRSEITALTQEAATVTKQLANVGQADQTDVLQAEIEAQQAELATMSANSGYQRAFRELTAAVGMPGMQLQKLAGKLDADLPQLESATWMKTLLTDTPAIKIARSEVDRRRAEEAQARKAATPDLRVKAGLLHNREFAGASTRPVGWLGFAEVGIQIPLFNRNQGGMAAARIEVERAEHETKRTELLLQQRSAGIWEEYETAKSASTRYRAEILPRAQQAHELMTKRYGEMAAAYPQVLVARRTYLHMTLDYVAALDRLWSSAIELESFMLTDALESPARAGEMDRSVREINLPTRMASPER
ncbi:MAG: TolC family protein [Terriglobales bacterium]